MCNWINGNLTGTLSIGQGEPGKSLQYEWRGTELGIRVEGGEYQFVNLAGGGTGREIELQVGNGYIQWRYKDEEEWKNLISIDSLKGEPGPQGLPGETGPQGLPGRDGVNGKDGKNGIDGTNGQDGADGVTPDIKIGTVTTLEAGEKATVVNSGTKENPVFDFGIPKGEKGADGTGGSSVSEWKFLKEINLKEAVAKLDITELNCKECLVECCFQPTKTVGEILCYANCLNANNNTFLIKNKAATATSVPLYLKYHIICVDDTLTSYSTPSTPTSTGGVATIYTNAQPYPNVSKIIETLSFKVWANSISAGSTFKIYVKE